MNTSLMKPEILENLCLEMFEGHLHVKRRRSIALCALGAMHADDLSVAGVGRGLARARGMSPKHGIKQVDRFSSNDGIGLKKVFAGWVPWVVGDRDSIVGA